jgi:hypothetical protein
MMSISPTGLRQRRARMRKPLAMRNAAADLLVKLGEFAADGGLPRPERGREIGERSRDARPGLEQHERGRNELDLLDALAPLAFPGRQKSLEHEAVGRQRADRECRQHRAGARQGCGSPWR